MYRLREKKRILEREESPEQVRKTVILRSNPSLSLVAFCCSDRWIVRFPPTFLNGLGVV